MARRLRPKYEQFGCWRTGHGDHRPTMICKTNYSRTGSLCPVLQQEVRVFTPLSSGEGLGVGLFILGAGGRGTEATVLLWLAKNWREVVLYIYSFFCINIQHGEWIVKPIKLQSESMGFRLRNQGFQDAKAWVLGGKTHAFANEKYQL